MFDHLVESNKQGRRDVTGTMLGMFTSTTLQAAVMIGAVYATVRAPVDEHVAFIETILELPAEAQPQEQQPEQRPIVSILRPPPEGFQVLVLPAEIPTEIPPVDPGVAFDPRNYTGVGVEGGVFDGLKGMTGPVDDLAGIYEHSVVDEKPEHISCPALDYPRMMRQAGIEGQVLLRFIVEADGHVLTENIETLSTSHRAFEGPARKMIALCLFRPGRVRANAVRVLVQMPVIFSLTGGR